MPNKMPKGVYSRTEEQKQRLSRLTMGVYPSEETKQKMSLSHKGIVMDKSPNWKGGKIKINGYVYVKSHDHPFKNSDNYVAEHRLIVEKSLGRYLSKDEFIHHKNGIKNDNRIENLEPLLNRLHYGRAKCPYCQKEFLIR